MMTRLATATMILLFVKSTSDLRTNSISVKAVFGAEPPPINLGLLYSTIRVVSIPQSLYDSLYNKTYITCHWTVSMD